MTDKKAYTEKLKAELEEWNAEIDLMRAKAKNASADARLEYERQVDDLESQRDTVKTKLHELENSSTDAWEDLKQGADRIWKDMRTAVESAASRFR